MPIKIEMPRLSDTMQAGTVVKWNVKEGQKVKTGDSLADIETDKATMELQSFEDGTVASIAVAEGQNVPIGTVIMLLAGPGEDAAAIKSQGAGAAAPAKAQAAGQTGGQTVSTGSGGTATAVAPPGGSNSNANSNGHAPGRNERVLASPLAKKIAAETNVDLGSLQGSGPGGRIIRKDVEAAVGSGQGPGRGAGEQMQAPSKPSQPLARTQVNQPSRPTPMAMPGGAGGGGGGLVARVVPLSNMRKTIAKRLVESKTTIPHYQVTVEASMDALVELRAQLNEQLANQGVKLSVNDFVVRACALAMHQHPYVNTKWAGTPGNEAIEYLPDVNIGVAIALPVMEDGTGGGLVVATIRGADFLGLRQISAETKRLSEKARTKGLSVEEMSDATFTISNLGMFGVEAFTAIINPPNTAILAVGGAVQKPVVRDGKIVPGHVMSMTMSSDHRVIDGAMAASYLNSVKGLLEKPATLLV
ncbi:MAG: dihydrolipoamide acetyltransferase family protein [Phycisphaerales bacterium]